MPTVDIGSSTYPAFIDQDGADEFLAGDVARAVGWALRNPDAKNRGIVSATRLLLSMPWCEAAPDPNDAVPAVLAEVTAMLAADLVAKPKLFADASGSSNVKTAKAGSAQVEFFAPVEGGPPIPRALWDLLVRAGLLCLPDRGGAVGGAYFTGTSDGCRPFEGRYADYAGFGWAAQDPE